MSLLKTSLQFLGETGLLRCQIKTSGHHSPSDLAQVSLPNAYGKALKI